MKGARPIPDKTSYNFITKTTVLYINKNQSTNKSLTD